MTSCEVRKCGKRSKHAYCNCTSELLHDTQNQDELVTTLYQIDDIKGTILLKHDHLTHLDTLCMSRMAPQGSTPTLHPLGEAGCESLWHCGGTGPSSWKHLCPSCANVHWPTLHLALTSRVHGATPLACSPLRIPMGQVKCPSKAYKQRNTGSEWFLITWHHSSHGFT